MADVQLTGSIAPSAASSVAPSTAVAPTPAASSGGTNGAPQSPVQADGTEASAAPGKTTPGAPGNSNAKPPSADEVKAAVKQANLVLSGINTQLVFVFDDQSHHADVKLLDIQTQKVVKQIPSTAMTKTATALSGAQTSGTLVDDKV
jgi:uncharacterized FlaG/YvyC family protein